MIDFPDPTSKHPMTGAALVHADVEERQDAIRLHRLPPLWPEREVVEEYDDDGYPTRTRQRTDEELAEARAEWEKHRHQTVIHGRGTTTVIGRFEFEDGSTLEGVWGGASWRWLAGTDPA